MYAKKKKDTIILKPKLQMGDEFKIEFGSKQEAELFMQDIIEPKTNKQTKRFERHNCVVRQNDKEIKIKFIETNRRDKVCCIIKFSQDEIGKDKSSFINIIFDKIASEFSTTFADLMKGLIKGDNEETSEESKSAVKEEEMAPETLAKKQESNAIDHHKLMTREEHRQLRREAEREKEREKERRLKEEMEQFIKDDPLQDAVDWLNESIEKDKNKINLSAIDSKNDANLGL